MRTTNQATAILRLAQRGPLLCLSANGERLLLVRREGTLTALHRGQRRDLATGWYRPLLLAVGGVALLGG